MTGIFLSFHPTTNLSPSTLQNISRLLKHRGSSDGSYLYVDSSYQCHFGDHPIDMDDVLVSVVYTPLSNGDNNVHSYKNDGEWFWAVVDGSIYDPELRRINEGARILVDSYLKQGTSAFKSLDGNFSFVLYDGKKKMILASRDNVGSKPLHYYRNLDQIAFSSEIKGFLALNWFKPRINVRNVQRFIARGKDNFYEVKTRGLWETFFEGVFEIPSSHYVKINLETHQRRLGSYWNLHEPTDIKFEKDSNAVTRRFLELFRRSVTQSLLNDGKKVATTLSGGIDSTFVTYLLEEAFTSRKMDLGNLYSMSVVFPELKGEPPDESPWIKKFLRSSKIENSSFITPSPSSFETNYEKVLWHYEQPLTDDSLFLLWEVVRHAEEEGIKTLYGAVAALTGGNINAYIADLLLTSPFKAIRKWIEFTRAGKIKPCARKIRTWLFIFLLGSRAHRLREKKGVPEGVKRYREFWAARARNGQCTKYFDRSSMAFGVEYKEPFNSNSKLFEFSMHLPENSKHTEGWTNYIHRRAMFLLQDFPKEIIWNPYKMSFSGPMKRWVYEDLFDFFLETLSNAKYVDKLVNIPTLIKKFRKKEFNPYWAWRIVNVELWCRLFFDARAHKVRLVN